MKFQYLIKFLMCVIIINVFAGCFEGNKTNNKIYKYNDKKMYKYIINNNETIKSRIVSKTGYDYKIVDKPIENIESKCIEFVISKDTIVDLDVDKKWIYIEKSFGDNLIEISFYDRRRDISDTDISVKLEGSAGLIFTEYKSDEFTISDFWADTHTKEKDTAIKSFISAKELHELVLRSEKIYSVLESIYEQDNSK